MALMHIVVTALAIKELRRHLTAQPVAYAPRGATMRHMEIPTVAEKCDDAEARRIAKAIVDSLPHWATTAKFRTLPVGLSYGLTVDVCTDPLTGASVRCRVVYDGILGCRVMLVDWLFVPVQAPGTWARRKRHARYRRGREGVRPRHRGRR